MYKMKNVNELSKNMPMYDFIGKTIETLEYQPTGMIIKFTDGTYGCVSLGINLPLSVNITTPKELMMFLSTKTIEIKGELFSQEYMDAASKAFGNG
jgi:hypothetical protein